MEDAAADQIMSLALRRRLEQRLEEWAAEYLNFPNTEGTAANILQLLIDHKGFIPRGTGGSSIHDRSKAEEVDDVVNSMLRAGWWLHAMILRMEYWRPEPAMEQRLEIIRGRGVSIGRTGYFSKLAEAKMYVAGALFRL